jgi:hypothetical protein
LTRADILDEKLKIMRKTKCAVHDSFLVCMIYEQKSNIQHHTLPIYSLFT